MSYLTRVTVCEGLDKLKAKFNFIHLLLYQWMLFEVAKLMFTTVFGILSQVDFLLSWFTRRQTAYLSTLHKCWKKFVKEYGLTSSLKYPQANAAAEQAVKAVKHLQQSNE